MVGHLKEIYIYIYIYIYIVGGAKVACDSTKFSIQGVFDDTRVNRRLNETVCARMRQYVS